MPAAFGLCSAASAETLAALYRCQLSDPLWSFQDNSWTYTDEVEDDGEEVDVDVENPAVDEAGPSQ